MPFSRHEVTSGTHWWNSEGKRATAASSGQLENMTLIGIEFGTLSQVTSVSMRVFNVQWVQLCRTTSTQMAPDP